MIALLETWAYEAWILERGKPVLLGGGTTRGDCDRMLGHTSAPGVIAKGGAVMSVKSGTSKQAAGVLTRAVEADWRSRGGAEPEPLPVPSESGVHRAPSAVRLVNPPPPEEPEDDELPPDEDDQDPEGEDDEDLAEFVAAEPPPAMEPPAAALAPKPLAPAEPPMSPKSKLPEILLCSVRGCSEPRGPMGRVTRPETAACCTRHRKFTIDAVAKGRTTYADATAYMSEGSHKKGRRPMPMAARVEALRKSTAAARAEPTAASADSYAEITATMESGGAAIRVALPGTMLRAVRLAQQVGGIEALEQFVAAVLKVRGAR